MRRHDAAKATDYYFLYNQVLVSPPNEPTNLFEPEGDEAFDGQVHLQGNGKPYLMDAWSGKITPIADYASDGSGVTVHVHLAADDAMLIALSGMPLATAPDGAEMGARKSSAATLAPIDMTQAKWHLVVEDWEPAKPYGATGAQASETMKQTVQLDLDGLKPWPQIPAIRDVSGVGTYTTSVSLPADWKSGTSATLKLGEVCDSFALSVNGKNVPADQISATVEVGPYLHAGVNTIQVRVATTLNNRLSTLEPLVAKRGLVQQYGLIGPVILIPR